MSSARTTRMVGWMAAKKALPDAHHVMRFASKQKRFIHPDTLEPMGPSPAAFALREGDEGGVSVVEVEHFGAFDLASRRSAAIAHRNTTRDKKLGPQAIFAWAKVVDVVGAGKKYGKALRVVSAPVDGNPAHAEIRHFAPEDIDILDYYATDVFQEWCTVKDLSLTPHNAAAE
jgi:hypothetical protein